jgi:hypothetical protein
MTSKLRDLFARRDTDDLLEMSLELMVERERALVCTGHEIELYACSLSMWECRIDAGLLRW